MVTTTATSQYPYPQAKMGPWESMLCVFIVFAVTFLFWWTYNGPEDDGVSFMNPTTHVSGTIMPDDYICFEKTDDTFDLGIPYGWYTVGHANHYQLELVQKGVVKKIHVDELAKLWKNTKITVVMATGHNKSTAAEIADAKEKFLAQLTRLKPASMGIRFGSETPDK